MSKNDLSMRLWTGLYDVDVVSRARPIFQVIESVFNFF